MITARGLTFDAMRHEEGILADNLACLDVVPSPLRTVVDIGAHVGFTSIPAAARGAQVFALEPNPWTYATLVKNIERNRLWDHVIPLQVALAPDWIEGTVGLRSRGLDEPGMTGLVQPETEPVIGYAVPISPWFLFNTIVHERIDYLKIDIEGYEHYVLPVMTSDQWERVRWLHLEIHDLDAPEMKHFHASWGKNADLEGLLRSQGFVQVKNLPVWRNTNHA